MHVCENNVHVMNVVSHGKNEAGENLQENALSLDDLLKPTSSYLNPHDVSQWRLRRQPKQYAWK